MKGRVLVEDGHLVREDDRLSMDTVFTSLAPTPVKVLLWTFGNYGRNCYFDGNVVFVAGPVSDV